jgi:Protein of unknown function DUF262
MIDKLLEEIEKKRTSFKTESYAMSIGELVNLYENEEIIIRPEYQRLFRWTHGQKVKLVESIILGIPIPSVFVYQDDKGIWELVDGLQRVSTILQLFGVLKDTEPLVLEGTKYIPTLEGYKWEEGDNELPAGLKLSIKRAKINLTIILSESDERAKFEVFQRLNTGGSNASNQEVRNNVMLMIDRARFLWFENLSKNLNFLETLSLSDRLYDEQYHMELLLRFISLTQYTYNNKKDVGDFLDDINEDILNSETFDFVKVEENFELTFETLNRILGEKSFKKYTLNEFKGKFLESAFEAVAVGLAINISGYDLPQDDEIIKTKIQSLYKENTYNQTSGSGSNAKTRIPKLVPFAKAYFAK